MKSSIVIFLLCLLYAYGQGKVIPKSNKRGQGKVKTLLNKGHEDQGKVKTVLNEGHEGGVTNVLKVNTFTSGKANPMDLSEMALFTHNDLRKRHGAGKLSWDNNLAIAAQAWVKKIAAKASIEHSPGSKDGKIGENVGYNAMPFAGAWGPSYLIMLWYGEYHNPGFNFKDPENGKNGGAGHFSQVVWKATQKVGCGMAKVPGANGDDTYLVCQYLPGGNMAGQYGANVADLSAGQSSPKIALDVTYEGCVDYGAGQSSPKIALDVTYEGCVDYGDSTIECTNMKDLCSQYSFMKEVCCDSCK